MVAKTCCIFSAGEYYGSERLPDGDFFAIAADGGYHTACRMGVSPDVLIGDFDSLGAETPDCEVVRLQPEKDDTDTLSAVKLALARGCDRFYFYGCTGGRTAHTVANLQMICLLAERGCTCWMFGNREIFTCIHNGAVQFDPSSTGYLSVFSLSDESVGVYERGLKYPLEHYRMTNNCVIGVSNEFIGCRATVSVGNGTLLLIYTDKAREIGRTEAL